MGLFSRFRRRPRAEDYLGRHRPGNWSAPALPPIEPAPQVTPQDVEPVTAAGAAPLLTSAPGARRAEPPAPPILSPDIPQRQRVRLGFADGTSVDIDDTSGESRALYAAAQRLVSSKDPYR